MVEIKDIVDRESLEAWLKGRPRIDMVAIAHRAVLRLLPKYWYILNVENLDEDPDYMLLRFFRMGLLSNIGSNKNARPQGASLKRISKQSYHEASDFNLSSNHAEPEELIFESAIDAVSTIFSEYPLSASCSAVVSSIAAASHDGWLIIVADCEKLENGSSLSTVPIFRVSKMLDAKNRRDIEREYEVWNEVVNEANDGEYDWSFWIKWYEAALNGDPLNYEMLERIALIPLEDWEQGPKHVNAIIAEIEGESEWAEPEIEVTPTHMLSRNKSVIESQLDTLFQLVAEEINRLRGQNDFTKAEGERIAARRAVLESILAAVEKIKAALEGEAPSTALAVIEEHLPEVLSGAAELVKGEDEPQVSVSIAQMGEMISFLTQKGTPGTLATGMAFVDWSISHPIKWWKHWRKSKN